MSHTSTVSRTKRAVTKPRRVDFFMQMQDLRCVLLAAAGLSTAAIAGKTGLTECQVSYRLGKSEQGRRRGDPTQRSLYRQGMSPIASLVVALASGSGPIREQVTERLYKRGLYTPKSR